jgi:hypothetical protein
MTREEFFARTESLGFTSEDESVIKYFLHRK